MPTGFHVHAQAAAQSHGYQLDDAQISATRELDRLYLELVNSEKLGQSLIRLFRGAEPLRGVYLWGSVGRGKSFLMDAFYDAVPIERKTRVHFHRFMQEIHHRLRALKGEANPLRVVGREIGRETRLLCLDEFHITDIGDAMLMRNLLEALFSNAVTLVTTSNSHPEALYEHGLQRAQFLPAIELLLTHLECVSVDGDKDYRLAMLEKAGVYHTPLGMHAETAMTGTFCNVSGEAGQSAQSLEIEGRTLKCVRLAHSVVWFDFQVICGDQRGQADYIELARRFHTVLISAVPSFSVEIANERRRFTWLVDEFYDRRVKLVLSADDDLPGIFANAEGGTETDRTLSRLIEMQSRRYLGLAHLS